MKRLLFILPVLLLLACSSPQVVERDRVEIRHDTVRQIVMQHDTLTTADSVITFIHERGDTLILRERVVRTKDRIVMRHDTVYILESTSLDEAVITSQPPDHTLRNRIIIALLAASFIGGGLFAVYKEL